MRKIERDMIAAIRASKNRALGNTYVNPVVGGIEIRLHGSLIAVLTDQGLRFTLAGWPTPTTRSRINALLRAFVPSNAWVYQEHGQQKFHKQTGQTDGWERRTISPTEWVQA